MATHPTYAGSRRAEKDQFDMKQNSIMDVDSKYSLYPSVIDSREIESAANEAARVYSHYYNEDNLRKRRVYFPDRSGHRQSHALSIWTGKNSREDAINIIDFKASFPQLGALTETVLSKYLKITTQTRLLINFQFYLNQSTPVLRHFDGEYLSYCASSDRICIRKGIRPRDVGILTLVNEVPGAGTRIFYPDGKCTTIVTHPGDLLLLDNHNLEHSVESIDHPYLKCKPLRVSMGWRSLDYDCQLWEDDKFSRILTQEEANIIYEQWLISEWPTIYEGLASRHHSAPF